MLLDRRAQARQDLRVLRADPHDDASGEARERLVDGQRFLEQQRGFFRALLELGAADQDGSVLDLLAALFPGAREARDRHVTGEILESEPRHTLADEPSRLHQDLALSDHEAGDDHPAAARRRRELVDPHG